MLPSLNYMIIWTYLRKYWTILEMPCLLKNCIFFLFLTMLSSGVNMLRVNRMENGIQTPDEKCAFNSH